MIITKHGLKEGKFDDIILCQIKQLSDTVTEYDFDKLRLIIGINKIEDGKK